MANRPINNKSISGQFDEFLENSKAPMMNQDFLPAEEPKVELPVQQPIQQPIRQPVQQAQPQIQEPVIQPSNEEVKPPNELDSLISEYKKALSDSEKSMQINQEDFKKAQWADAIVSLSRTLRSATGQGDRSPDQTNFAKQYMDQVAAQREGATSSLESRAKLLDMYRRMNAPKSPTNDYYKDMNLRLRMQGMQNQLDEKAMAREEKKEFRAKLSPEQAKELEKIDLAIGEVDSIITAKQTGKINTGPFSNIQSNIAEMVGMDDAEKTAFKSRVGKQLAEYVKEITGAGVGQKERDILNKNIPNMSDDDDTFNKKIKVYKDILSQGRKVKLASFEKQGKNIENYRSYEEPTPQQKNQPTSESGNKFPMQVRRPLQNGKSQVATVSNEADLQAAREKGFN